MAGIHAMLLCAFIFLLVGVNAMIGRPEDERFFPLPMPPTDAPNRCSYNNGGCMQTCDKDAIEGYHCRCKVGFKLLENRRDCEKVQCHHETTSTRGEITSPNYPDPYPGRQLCDWLITTTPGDQIKLIFQDIDLKNYGSCDYDTINVYDGDSDKSTALGSFCRRSSTRPLIASGNLMYLVFTSRTYAPENKGFKAKYTTVSYYNETNSSRGQISSPNYPDDYPSGKIYGWLFTTSPGHRIKLDFHDFNLEFDDRCACDNVTVYDGVSEDYPVLGTFCGSSVPAPLISAGKEMYLEFKSDKSLQRTGFNATHTTVCGGHLRDDVSAGIFYSHVNFDNGKLKRGFQESENSESEVDCEWILEASDNEKIVLEFLRFRLFFKIDGECSYEYVEVYDGKDDSAKSFGKYCGWKDNFIFMSSGNSLMVRFRSKNSGDNFYGFSAKWKAFDPSQPFFSHPFCDGKDEI